jgi:hypothetical protein
MAGVFILFPGISEADDEGEWHGESGGSGVDGGEAGQEIIVAAAVGKPIADGYEGGRSAQEYEKLPTPHSFKGFDG